MVLRDNARSALAAMVRSLFSRLAHHEVPSASASHETAETNIASPEPRNENDEQTQKADEATFQRGASGDKSQSNEQSQMADEAADETDSQQSTTVEEPQSDEQLETSESNACSSEQNDAGEAQPCRERSSLSATMVEVSLGRSGVEAPADPLTAQSSGKMVRENVSKKVRYTMRCIREVFR